MGNSRRGNRCGFYRLPKRRSRYHAYNAFKSRKTRSTVIRQGDLFWLDYDESEGSEAGFHRPVLVVQNNLYNERDIRTTGVCALTSSLRRAQNRGNILLENGEGNLAKQSVVIVSQVDTVDKDQLQEFIGTLGLARVRQVLAAMWGVFATLEAV